jgi:hypothetical protein
MYFLYFRKSILVLYKFHIIIQRYARRKKLINLLPILYFTIMSITNYTFTLYVFWYNLFRQKFINWIRYVNEICSDNIASPFGNSLVTSSLTCKISCNGITKESPNGDIKIHKKTLTNSIVQFVNHQTPCILSKAWQQIICSYSSLVSK